MTLYMINVRMRRVEPITKHARWSQNDSYKAYQGSRMWTLTDSQVFDSESKALKHLKWELERLKHSAQQTVLKLDANLKIVEQQMADAVSRESEALPGTEWPRCTKCHGLMPNSRLRSNDKTCGIGGCP
jgi:hypothetical protein